MFGQDTRGRGAVRRGNGAIAAQAMGPTLARLFVQRFAAGLESLGLDVVRIFGRCDLDPARLDSLPDRLPWAVMVRLFVAAREVSRDPGIALRLAEQVQPETWEMLGYVIKSSGTLGDALLRAGRYLRLLSDATELSLHVEGERAILLHRNPYPELKLPEGAEFVLAAVTTIGGHLSGRRLAPLEVRFQHAAPADTSIHARVFRAPVRFRQPHNALVIDEAVLHVPIGSRDPRLCTLLERQAAQLLATLPEPRRFTRAVEEIVATELHEGRIDAVHVATRLGIHPKTLSRRLKAEGTSHRRLVEDVRRDLAERYLSVSDKTVTEVAFLLGYSDASAFHKAFVRWKGVGPDVYRRRSS
jgi:AraC-like DNA-binding protein